MRLVSLGNTIIDVTVAIGDFPEQGGDVLAHSGALHAGGSGFNVMCAASRLGMNSVYAGMHGTGPFGDAARTAMAKEGIALVHAPDPTGDTGWDIAITDESAERTFITVVGAEARLTDEYLAQVTVHIDDVVYISGYSLLAEPNRSAICGWLRTIPEAITVVTDPGPLIADIPPEALQSVLARTTWWSANEREATLMTGLSDPAAAAAQILTLRADTRGGVSADTGGGVILRLGAAGCLVAQLGQAPHPVPGITVEAIDTNGAGDAHVGAFIASLLTGHTAVDSAGRANAAAAFSVTRSGPATAPTLSELDQILGA